MKVTRVALGYPWYVGPDVDCFSSYQGMLFYFGRLRERSLWYQQIAEKGVDASKVELPALDTWEGDPRAEVLPEDGVFEFSQAVETRCSLPGLARERLADMALSVGADWLFTWDADMRFPLSTFLRLWRHQKPIVNALAFTSREPILPCVYRIRCGWDSRGNREKYTSETALDFPDDTLVGDEEIGGQLAFGAGVVLINTNVFRQISKPWYHSTGCGEDWMFCVRAAQFGIPRYVDTSFDIQHKRNEARWADKESYRKAREEHPEEYERWMKKEKEENV